MSADDKNLNGQLSEDDMAPDMDRDITNVEANVSAKELERLRIRSEVEEFLSRGGTITQVESNVMTDPPKRPESNYGGQPI